MQALRPARFHSITYHPDGPVDRPRRIVGALSLGKKEDLNHTESSGDRPTPHEQDPPVGTNDGRSANHL